MSEQTHRLVLMPAGRQGEVPKNSTLLEAAHDLGVEIEAICGGRQTCGRCLVNPEYDTQHRVNSKPEHLSPPTTREQATAKRLHIDLSQQRLACAAHITGDIVVAVPETSQARKQVIQKAASDRTIEVAPAIRLYYVEVPDAVLAGRADLERLQIELAEQWGLHDLKTDFALLSSLQQTLRQQQGAVTVTVWRDETIIRIEPGYVESFYGLAVDVGSTTLAAHLCDLRTGEVLATKTMMNPQVRYGEDIVSRIAYATSEAEGAARLHKALIDALNKLSRNAAYGVGIEYTEITEVVLVGNSVMHHLLLGLDPAELGHLPFALAVESAVDVKAADIGLNNVYAGARVHVLPCIAGYVGADNVGVLLAEWEQLDEEITLIVDIGTNAEILLGNRQRLLSASSPTGPAFEGAQITHGQRAATGAIERVRIDGDTVQYKVVGDNRWSFELAPDESLRPTGICGSGIIEAIAEMLIAGIIKQNGRFVVDDPRVQDTNGIPEFVLATTDTGRSIVITQHDVRAIQLAKGGLMAGIRLLMDEIGIDRVDRIRLAGAFGSYIDPEYAMRIGLIPRCDLDDVAVIGNAAGDGARIALLNLEQRRLAEQLARQVDYVETAASPEFQDYFVQALSLETN